MLAVLLLLLVWLGVYPAPWIEVIRSAVAGLP
jgi:NADH:ubiquinone oxidoreductase subunit 4 (subunit M)